MTTTNCPGTGAERSGKLDPGPSEEADPTQEPSEEANPTQEPSEAKAKGGAGGGAPACAERSEGAQKKRARPPALSAGMPRHSPERVTRIELA